MEGVLVPFPDSSPPWPAAPSSPRLVGMSSCAAGHDRPTLGPASALDPTEQMIDRPHRGGWHSSSVRQNPAADGDAVGEDASVPPGPLWPTAAAGRRLPEDFHLLPPGRAATSGRAEPGHIGGHLPHGSSRSRGTDMQRAQKVSI